MSIKNAFSSVADPEHLAESRSELTVSGSTSLMNTDLSLLKNILKI